MKGMKRIGALLLSACIIMGLGACGGTGDSQSAGQPSASQRSGKSKSGSTSTDDSKNSKSTKAQPEGKIVSDWRERYHCADRSEYGSLPDFDLAGQVILAVDDGCVIIVDGQTVNVPIMDAPSVDGVIKVTDRLLGELPVTFDSSDVGSWSITVDASNLKPATLTGVNKDFTVGSELCYGGSCPGGIQNQEMAFGETGTVNVTGGTTVVVRFFFAGAGDVAVIRRG
ncbi:hypothetical protein [Bifidobacterium parmae]|uniref:Lipoprotein n=1 Tax=Bifidobacterium parmae TaxID=361854 RepID=A0A2N5J6J0_9BIFI|nr:hypothetical protein [Bifidobacterium parmae]PLS29818.1 hypothetical protein Uis4E_0159 [Bifidobacterium parmae]